LNSEIAATRRKERKLWVLILVEIAVCFAAMFAALAIGWSGRDYIKFFLLFPIYQAGSAFGLKGGISAGIIVTVLYLLYAPVEPFHVNSAVGVLCIIPMLIFLNLLGVFSGWAVGRGRKANKDAETASEAMLTIGGSTTERDVMMRLVEQTVRLTGAEAAAVVLNPSPDSDVSSVPTVFYSIESGFADLPALDETHPLMRCVSENKLFSCSSADADERLIPLGDSGVKSMLAAPMRSKNGVTGAVALINKNDGMDFDEEDVSLIQLAADAAAAVVANIGQERRRQEELAREKRSKELFSRFVSSSVADHVLSNPDLLKSRRQLISILITDIRDFTTISERISPQELVRSLNEYFTVIVDVVFKRNGTIDKYIGDCVVAYWGAPAPDEQHAENAAHAALDILAAVDVLNARWASEGRETFRTGVGVHTAEALVGNVGDNRKTMFTIIGEEVDKAMRTESLTKRHGAKLLVSRQTADLISNKFAIQRIDDDAARDDELFTIKGLI
jgi:class 3 adenylate cyclase